MVQSRFAITGAVVWLMAVFATPVADAQTRVPEQRYFLSVDGGGQSGSQQLHDQGGIGMLFGEPIVLEADYGIERSGGVFRTNATVLLKGSLGVGFGFTRSTATGSANATVQAPHPIFLNRPRAAGESITAQGHRESTVHLHAAYIVQLVDRVHVQFFGGPSFVRVEQAVLTNATLGSEVFPFDTIELLGVSGMEVDERAVGFNVGADFGYMIGPFWGVGGFVQYAGGKVELPLLGGLTSLTLGGFQFGGGIRLRY